MDTVSLMVGKLDKEIKCLLKFDKFNLQFKPIMIIISLYGKDY